MNGYTASATIARTVASTPMRTARTRNVRTRSGARSMLKYQPLRGLLQVLGRPQPVDGGVEDVHHGPRPVGDQQHVEIHNLVATALAQPRDPAARREALTIVQQAQVLHGARGVDPGPEGDIGRQEGVGEV